MKMEIEFYNTIGYQVELLPRITIGYWDNKLLAVEWLWFGVCFSFEE